MLSGCGSGETAAVSLRGISFTADITYLNENYTADCLIENNGDFKAVMLTPESINGLEFLVSNSKSKLIFRGIEITDARRFLPQNSSVLLMIEALQNNENAYSSGENGNTRINGEVGGHAYILICSPAGLPISLAVADYGMTVVFKNLKYI